MFTYEIRLLFLRKPGDRINICGIVGYSSQVGWQGSIIEFSAQPPPVLTPGEQEAFGVIGCDFFYRMIIS